MEIIPIILLLLQYFLNPDRIKKREEERKERESEKLSHEIDEHIFDLDPTMIALDIDKLLKD